MVRAVKPHLQFPFTLNLRQLNCRVSKNIFHEFIRQILGKRIYSKDFILSFATNKQAYDKLQCDKGLNSLWKRLFYRAMKNK